MIPIPLVTLSSWISSVMANETIRLSFQCSLVSNAFFWIASGLGLVADHLVATAAEKQTQSKMIKRLSGFLRAHKIQPNTIILGTDRIDLIRLAFFNMVVVASCVCCPLFGYLWDYTSASSTHHNYHYNSPDYAWMWKQEVGKILFFAVVAEVGFYAGHTFLHWSPFLYKKIHKVHHRFPAPTAMTCVYAHPLEFCFGNVFPIYLGPIIWSAFGYNHPTTCYVWWGLAMLGTCKGHSGYQILGHQDDYEAHHLLYRYNYGGMGLLDRLLGTTPPPTLSLQNTQMQKTPQTISQNQQTRKKC